MGWSVNVTGHNRHTIFYISQSRVHRNAYYTEQQDGDSLSTSVNSSSSSLNPALRLAAMHGVASAIRLHVERNDPLNARDVSSQTALMISARRNHLEACAVLLEAGADPDLRDEKGLTALNLAAQAGATDTHRMLVELERKRVQPVSVSDCVLQINNSPDCRPASGLVAHSALQNTQDQASATTSVDWEPVTEAEPPQDDLTLRGRASQTQASISVHIPFDSKATSWDEVSVYLPEGLHSGVSTGPFEEGLRVVILRCIREGSVPYVQLDSLLEEEEPSNAENVRRLITQVVQDLGAEMDERLEMPGVFEDHRVAPPENATDDEALTQDEAVAYLEGLLRPRNDPGRIFAKQAYNLPQLTHEDEIEIARAMEQALEGANDVLSGWQEGLDALLKKCEEVRSGKLALRQVKRKRNAATDELPVSEGESGEHHAPLHIGQPRDLDHGEDDDSESEDQAGVTELNDFIGQTVLLRQLTTSTAMRAMSRSKIGAVLDNMSLSGTFLCSLDNSKALQAEAREFSLHITKYLKSRDRLVLSNLRLVVPLAKRYLAAGADFTDLLQEGHIGLIRAVDKFDWRRGFKFSTMAIWWIRQQISRTAPEHARLIRLPVHGMEKTWEMKRLIQNYQDEHGQVPSVRWIAERLGMTEPKAESYLRTMSEPLSLEALDSSHWVSATDETDPLENAARRERVDRAEVLLQHLGSKPRGKTAEKVLRMRYGIGVASRVIMYPFVAGHFSGQGK
jgi:RNA polymerase primary sigma factor